MFIKFRTVEEWVNGEQTNKTIYGNKFTKRFRNSIKFDENKHFIMYKRAERKKLKWIFHDILYIELQIKNWPWQPN